MSGAELPVKKFQMSGETQKVFLFVAIYVEIVSLISRALFIN